MRIAATHELERSLDKAALAPWSDFPREVQEDLFEMAEAISWCGINSWYGINDLTKVYASVSEAKAAGTNSAERPDPPIANKGAAHKNPLTRKWLAKRPRWHVYPARTSSSWLNQVERFFALLTDKK